MKKMLIILGVGLVSGAVSYAIWKQLQREKSRDTNKNVVNTADENDEIRDIRNAETDVCVIRNSAAEEINDRHNEAAQIMKDAVDVICKRSEVSENETEELEQISDELDNLLEED